MCRRRALALLVGAAILALPLPPGAGAAGLLRGALADSAAAALGEGPLRGSWGVLVVSLDRGDTLLALDPERRLIPGSNQKLFTAGAFLRLAPPGTRASTVVSARGKARRKGPAGGVRLTGDLVLRGSGVPDVWTLLSPGSRGLADTLAALLRASGLTRFEGTLWVDGRLFARNDYPKGWAVEDVPLGYGARVNAILANRNAASVVATADTTGTRVGFDPPETPLALEAAVLAGGAGDAPWLTVSRDLCGRTVRALGVVPKGQTIRRTVSLPDPDSAAGLFLLGAMRRAGIETHAVVRIAGAGASKDPTRLPSEADGSAPAEGNVWAGVSEGRTAPVLALLMPPSQEIVAAVLAHSLNAESEALLRWLDPSPSGKSADRALDSLRVLLARAGLDTADVSPVDASGLSPQNLTTPRALVGWLGALERDSTLGVPFSSLLPSPGARGTLERRFGGPGQETPIHAKTGTLTNVSALSGYTITGDGDRVVFSILSNGNPGSVGAARAAEEALVRQVQGFRRPVYGPPAPAVGVPR